MDFIGIVEVPISHLLFVEGSGERLYDDENRDRLTELLRDTHKDHTNVRHLIEGYIDTSEAGTILHEAGTSSFEIRQQNKHGKYPLIGNAIVRYTQGRHRIAAAAAMGSAALWAVRLYQTNIGRLSSNPVVRRRTEQYQHEKPYTDGHIYAKLRIYQDKASNYDYHEWYHRLTKQKKIGMRAIDQRVNISLELNKLTGIPAVLDELYLTTFQKSFVLRLDEELLAGIQNLYSEWFRLAGGNMNILKQMDKKTVAALAGRAPRVCPKDRLFIDAVFSSGQVFPKVDKPGERDALRLRVQQSIGLIPSLSSLQSNLRFLGIAAKIIWQYLIPQSLRLKAKQSKLSLRATLRGCWTSTTPYIEIREGEFAFATGPPSFDLVYIQLVLAAIRQFPYLSGWEPKMERGETVHFTRDPHHAALFVRRAKLLGIETATIDENISSFIPDNKHAQQLQLRNLLDESEVLARLENRWGRPSASIYWRIRQEGFLPTLMTDTAASRLSAIFVLGSTLTRCFTWPSFDIDFAQGVRFLTPQHRQLETITEEDELNEAVDSRLNNRSGSDVSMRLDERSSSDVSMRDAGHLSDGGSSSDVSMSDASFSEDMANRAGRAVASEPLKNQVLTEAAIFDTLYPHSEQHGRHDTGTGQLNVSDIATLSQSNRNMFIHSLQSQKLTNLQPRYKERDWSAFKLPHIQEILPSESRHQTTRSEDGQSVPPCIQIGESAMTPPGSFYRPEDAGARLPSIPPSLDRRSSMAATHQAYGHRDALLEQSNWHREGSTGASNSTIPIGTMLEPTVPPSPCVPRRLSEVPTATMPSSMSISDLQSISSRPHLSYIHSNSPSHVVPPPSVHSDTATRSSYTMPPPSYENGGGATSTQKSKYCSPNWQGFVDSDDEYESIDID